MGMARRRLGYLYPELLRRPRHRRMPQLVRWGREGGEMLDARCAGREACSGCVEENIEYLHRTPNGGTLNVEC